MRADGFFIGLHQPSDAKHFARACISINRLRTRVKTMGDVEVMVDSGAFMELKVHHEYRHSVEEYAAAIDRLWRAGVCRIVTVVAQDYMCEGFMLKRTGKTVLEHQRMTIERYDGLVAELKRLGCPVTVLPVLQGYTPAEYVDHLRAYGDRLTHGMCVGVGSVCKRNGDPGAVAAVLHAIKTERPDLELHGFGIKQTALKHYGVRLMLSTADSMAWSDHERHNKRNANDWRAAQRFLEGVHRASTQPAKAWQMELVL